MSKVSKEARVLQTTKTNLQEPPTTTQKKNARTIDWDSLLNEDDSSCQTELVPRLRLPATSSSSSSSSAGNLNTPTQGWSAFRETAAAETEKRNRDLPEDYRVLLPDKGETSGNAGNIHRESQTGSFLPTSYEELMRQKKRQYAYEKKLALQEAKNKENGTNESTVKPGGGGAGTVGQAKKDSPSKAGPLDQKKQKQTLQQPHNSGKQPQNNKTQTFAKPTQSQVPPRSGTNCHNQKPGQTKTYPNASNPYPSTINTNNGKKGTHFNNNNNNVPPTFDTLSTPTALWQRPASTLLAPITPQSRVEFLARLQLPNGRTQSLLIYDSDDPKSLSTVYVDDRKLDYMIRARLYAIIVSHRMKLRLERSMCAS